MNSRVHIDEEVLKACVESTLRRFETAGYVWNEYENRTVVSSHCHISCQRDDDDDFIVSLVHDNDFGLVNMRFKIEKYEKERDECVDAFVKRTGDVLALIRETFAPLIEYDPDYIQM
jgi:hypothetical protein